MGLNDDERLLRQAKEYIRQQEEEDEGRNKRSERDHDGKKSNKRRKHDEDHDTRRHRRGDDDDDDDGRRKKRRHKDSDDRSHDERRHKRDRSERHKGQEHELGRKKRKQDKKTRNEGNDDSRRHTKHHKKKSKEQKHDNNKKKHLLVNLGPPRGKAPEQPLDAEADYFQYHQHLWAYLYREEGVLFNDLQSSQKAREAFARFVHKYNQGQLEQAYYDANLPVQVLEECKTTKHAWVFNISDQEGHTLSVLQDGVRKQTEYQGGIDQEKTAGPAQEETEKSEYQHREMEKIGHPSSTRMDDRKSSRRLKEHIRAAEEEFSGGRKEGRERQIEKRKELAEKIHGASKDHDGVELNDVVLYGDDDTGFKEALKRERDRTARREDKRTKLMAELEQKEKERQEDMLKKLGLTGIKPGQKIKIAPRSDGNKP